MNKETRIINHKENELRAVETDGKMQIKGFIPYNSKSLMLEGSYREVLQPRCFEDSLRSDEEIYALWSHDENTPLASTANGSLTLEDSDEGLNYTIDCANDPDAKRCWEKVKSGLIRGTSFGFIPVETNKDVQDNEMIRTITKAQLIECSPCLSPAYPESSVKSRSNDTGISEGEIKEYLELKRNERLEKGRRIKGNAIKSLIEI